MTGIIAAFCRLVLHSAILTGCLFVTSIRRVAGRLGALVCARAIIRAYVRGPACPGACLRTPEGALCLCNAVASVQVRLLAACPPALMPYAAVQADLEGLPVVAGDLYADAHRVVARLLDRCCAAVLRIASRDPIAAPKVGDAEWGGACVPEEHEEGGEPGAEDLCVVQGVLAAAVQLAECTHGAVPLPPAAQALRAVVELQRFLRAAGARVAPLPAWRAAGQGGWVLLERIHACAVAAAGSAADTARFLLRAWTQFLTATPPPTGLPPGGPDSYCALLLRTRTCASGRALRALLRSAGPAALLRSVLAPATEWPPPLQWLGRCLRERTLPHYGPRRRAAFAAHVADAVADALRHLWTPEALVDHAPASVAAGAPTTYHALVVACTEHVTRTGHADPLTLPQLVALVALRGLTDGVAQGLRGGAVCVARASGVLGALDALLDPQQPHVPCAVPHLRAHFLRALQQALRDGELRGLCRAPQPGVRWLRPLAPVLERPPLALGSGLGVNPAGFCADSGPLLRAFAHCLGGDGAPHLDDVLLPLLRKGARDVPTQYALVSGLACLLMADVGDRSQGLPVDHVRGAVRRGLARGSDLVDAWGPMAASSLQWMQCLALQESLKGLLVPGGHDEAVLLMALHVVVSLRLATPSDIAGGLGHLQQHVRGIPGYYLPAVPDCEEAVAMHALMRHEGQLTRYKCQCGAVFFVANCGQVHMNLHPPSLFPHPYRLP